MAPSIPITDKCEQCSKLLDEVLRCATCKTTGYCSRECQAAHWSAHKTGCSRLPANLAPAKIALSPALRDQEASVKRALLATLDSRKGAGFLEDTKAAPAREGAGAMQQPEPPAFLTPEFRQLAGLRLPSKFDYPSYGGHNRTDKHTFQHQLVQLIRLALLHTMATSNPQIVTSMILNLTPGGLFDRQAERMTALIGDGVPAILRGTVVGAAKLVAAKVMAAPGQLSRDEYLSLPGRMQMVYVATHPSADGDGLSDAANGWALLKRVHVEMDRNELLREWDCDA